MAKEYKKDDIHAPVEDTDVPFGLKILVLILFFVVAGAAGLILFSFESVRVLFSGG